MKIQGKALGRIISSRAKRNEKRCYPAYVRRRYYPQNEIARKTEKRQKKNERRRQSKYSARCVFENDAHRIVLLRSENWSVEQNHSEYH